MNNPSLMYFNEEVLQEVFPEDTLEKILIEDLTELQSVGKDYMMESGTFQNLDPEANFPSIHPSQLLLDPNLSCLQDTSSNRSTISSRETTSQVVSELHPDFLQITPGKCETY